MTALGGGTGVPLVDRPPEYVVPIGANPLAAVHVKNRETTETARREWEKAELNCFNAVRESVAKHLSARARLFNLTRNFAFGKKKCEQLHSLRT